MSDLHEDLEVTSTLSEAAVLDLRSWGAIGIDLNWNQNVEGGIDPAWTAVRGRSGNGGGLKMGTLIPGKDRDPSQVHLDEFDA